MTNNINEILATKRAWQNAERRKAERRQKDGTIEDRKTLADTLRAGRRAKCSCSICEYNRANSAHNWRTIAVWLLMCAVVVGLAIACHADEPVNINLDVIADIESGSDPMAHNNKSGATGEYQITQVVVDAYNNRTPSITEDTLGNPLALSDMYNPPISEMVANWYLNIKIPRLIWYYSIPDTTTSRLIAYNWGIGHLRHWFKNGAHWNRLPRETRNYIKKYFNETKGTK